MSALTHGPSLDGNDPISRHVSMLYYLLGMPSGHWCSWDDYSNIGVSSDAKPCTLGGDCMWES